MKKIYLLLIAIFSISLSHAQNIFPRYGKVGIGTSSPVGNLEIVDSLSGSKFKFNFFNTGAPMCGGIPTNPGIEFHTYDIGAGGSSSGYFSYQNYNFILDPLADNAAACGGGLVGIGEYNPNAKLDVAGTVMYGGSYANIGPTETDLTFLKNSGKMLMGWNRSGSEGEADFIANPGGGTNGGFAFFNYDNSGNETEAVRIKSNGYFGIGVTNPDQMLTVNGNIHAKEVLVNLTGFSDYVFGPAYKLPMLSEVKTYVEKNHHLPDMPSEAEIVKNGLKIGETENILTKKIEELTLYMIEKDKEVKDQRALLTAQQEQINLLKQEVGSNNDTQNELKVLKQQVALLLKQSIKN